MEKVTPDTTVWTASLWWRNNDPYWQIIGLDYNVVDEAVGYESRVAAAQAYDDDIFDSLYEAREEIMWGGRHKFLLGELVSPDELDEAIRDLEEDGYYHPEMA